MPSTQRPRVLIASNRGPVSFVRGDDGDVQPIRGQGGLVTALTGALQASEGLWIASAMSEEDRTQAGRRLDMEIGSSRYSLRFVACEEDTYASFYDGISNQILWFVHHLLWDLPRTPGFEGLGPKWEAYRRVNEAFAHVLDEEGDGSDSARYLIQDYHLALVPAMLRKTRPDARIAHFSHIPFAGPDYFAVLPSWLREELLAGMLGSDVIGFQAPAWAENFLRCCRALPAARVDLGRRLIRWEGRQVAVRVYPISVHPESLRQEASSDEVRRASEGLHRLVGDGRLLVRLDRAELSKNILRGLAAFEWLLQTQPARRGEVTFLAQLNPSRQQLSEYREYARECEQTAERINQRFAQTGWTPIHLSLEDDYPRALAAHQRYDVLLVNPIVDGMNLVAKEGPILNERDGVLILSQTAGAFTELGRHALPVNPFDVEATAHAIATALDMDPADRRARAKGLRAAVERNPIGRWIDAQLDDLGSAGA